jgi:hypothetical protein
MLPRAHHPVFVVAFSSISLSGSNPERLPKSRVAVDLGYACLLLRSPPLVFLRCFILHSFTPQQVQTFSTLQPRFFLGSNPERFPKSRVAVIQVMRVVCTVHLPSCRTVSPGPYFHRRPEFELIRREERKLAMRVNS